MQVNNQYQPPTYPGSSGSGCGKVVVAAIVTLLLFSGIAFYLFWNQAGEEPESSTIPEATRARATAKPGVGVGVGDDEETEEADDEQPGKTPAATKKPVATEIPRPDFRLNAYDILSVADINGNQAQEVLGSRFVDRGMNLVALDGATGQLLWDVELIDESAVPKMVEAGDLVVVVVNTTIKAFKLADGSVAWSAELPDRQVHDDPGTVGEGLIAFHTIDNTLTAYNLADGAVRWKHIFQDPGRADIRRLGDKLCAKQRNRDKPSYELVCYNLADGEASTRIPLGQMTSYQHWWADQSGDEPAIYMLNSTSPYEQALVQRITLAAPEPAQIAVLGKPYVIPHDNYLTFLVDQGRIAVGQEGYIAIVQEGGAVVETAQDGEHLLPIAFDGDVLYAASVKQRGTATLTVMGVSAATGQVLWQSDSLGTLNGLVKVQEQPWRLLPGVGLLIGWADEKNDIVHVTVYDKAGQQVWDRPLKSFIAQVPQLAVAGKRIFIKEDSLIAIDAKTGGVLWALGEY